MRAILDEQLIAGYLAGDKEALEILIKRYFKRIYGFVGLIRALQKISRASGIFFGRLYWLKIEKLFIFLWIIYPQIWTCLFLNSTK